MISLMYYAVRKYGSGDRSLLHSHDHYEFIFFPLGSGNIHYSEEDAAQGADSFTLGRHKEKTAIGGGSKIVFPLGQRGSPAMKTITFQSGSAVIFPPGTVHYTEYTGKEVNKISIGFSSDDADMIPFIYQNGVDKMMLSLLNEIDVEFVEKQYKYSDNICAYLSIIINRLMRASKEHPAESDSTTNIRYIINYIVENFSHDINLNELAKMAGYSPDHFRVLFKKETGCSPLKYITDKRLDLAKRLIEDISDMTLSDIAEYVGYHNYIHFTNIFKEKYGVSPSAMRRLKESDTAASEETDE